MGFELLYNNESLAKIYTYKNEKTSSRLDLVMTKGISSLEKLFNLSDEDILVINDSEKSSPLMEMNYFEFKEKFFNRIKKIYPREEDYTPDEDI